MLRIDDFSLVRRQREAFGGRDAEIKADAIEQRLEIGDVGG